MLRTGALLLLFACSLSAQTSESEPNDTLGAAGIKTITSTGQFTGTNTYQGAPTPIVDTSDIWYVQAGSSGSLTIKFDLPAGYPAFSASVTLYESSNSNRSGAAAVLEVGNGNGTSSFELLSSNYYYLRTSGQNNGPVGYTITLSGPATLPVELEAFAALPSGRNVALRWSTATEVNSAEFWVDRRAIGSGRSIEGSPWAPVGSVLAAGSSSSHREYRLVDRDLLPGRYAYRLRQSDKDGSVRVVREAEVVVAPTALVTAISQNYPNPFNPSTVIEFQAAEDGLATLEVFDILGREAMTVFEGPVQAGSVRRVVFDASGLAAGTYVARLGLNGYSTTRRIALVK